MKVSELSRAADVPLSTIKYYIREGLLPPGAATGRNQADYGPEHLKRLRLIRSLRDEAGLSLATITQVLRAADGAQEEPILAAVDALDPASGSAEPPVEAVQGATAVVLEVASRLGWKVEEGDVSLASAARALATLMPSFPEESPDTLVPYFGAAMDIARMELPDDWETKGTAEDALQYALLGTILFEPLILSLRRMAHVTRMREIRGATPKTSVGRSSRTIAKKKATKTKKTGVLGKKKRAERD